MACGPLKAAKRGKSVAQIAAAKRNLAKARAVRSGKVARKKAPLKAIRHKCPPAVRRSVGHVLK